MVKEIKWNNTNFENFIVASIYPPKIFFIYLFIANYSPTGQREFPSGGTNIRVLSVGWAVP